MARIYQVPSHTRLWLTLAVTFCALPQLLKGPLWQGGLFALVIAIRALVNRQRMALPGRIIRSLLLMGAVALTFYSFGRLYGPEAGVALLVSLFGLKYLEVVSQRDAYVLLVLGFFVCATSLLFSQSPLMFLYVLLCMVLLTACLAGINHSDTRASGMQHLKRAGIIMAQAVPLMLILFVLVPRVAPLWNMQVGNGKARTGMTDSMAPGQISELSESSALAFRVAFDGDMPPPAERYWRGLTLSHFDGRAWQQAIPRGMDEAGYLYSGRGPAPDWVDALTAGRSDGTSYAYQVIVEPTQRRWLFAMPVPFVSEGGVSLARDMRLVANNPVSQRQSYQVVSVPAATRRLPLAAEEKALMLSIPDESGRRARGLAQQWRLESQSDAAVVQQALRYFRQQPFHYTLRPPKLVADPIDDFLFRSRKGFCEHYASSFTFLMRAAGIPARVVVGYQGGEQNSLGSHLLVRQYDAHAWSEVWLEGQGWVRVDPTGAVAPERVERGLRAALEEGDSGDALGGIQLDGFAGSGLLGVMREWADYVDFRWQTWVLSYDSQLQLSVLSKLLGQVTPLRVAVTLMVSVALLLGLYGLYLFWRNPVHSQSPMEKEFWRLHQRVQGCGLALSPGVTPSQLAEAIAGRWPRAASPARDWARYYQRALYDPRQKASKQQMRHLRGLRNRLYKLLD